MNSIKVQYIFEEDIHNDWMFPILFNHQSDTLEMGKKNGKYYESYNDRFVFLENYDYEKLKNYYFSKKREFNHSYNSPFKLMKSKKNPSIIKNKCCLQLRNSPGIRVLLYKDSEYKFTDFRTVYSKLSHIEPELDIILEYFPCNIALDCYLTTTVDDSKLKINKKAKSGDDSILCFIYDIIGVNLSFDNRIKYLEYVFNKIEPSLKYIHMSDCINVDSEDDYEYIVNNLYSKKNLIIKNNNSFYEYGASDHYLELIRNKFKK